MNKVVSFYQRLSARAIEKGFKSPPKMPKEVLVRYWRNRGEQPWAVVASIVRYWRNRGEQLWAVVASIETRSTPVKTYQSIMLRNVLPVAAVDDFDLRCKVLAKGEIFEGEIPEGLEEVIVIGRAESGKFTSFWDSSKEIKSMQFLRLTKGGYAYAYGVTYAPVP